MAGDINVVVLVGRLTRDCELRTVRSTSQNSTVCRFSIAVNRRKRTGDNWEDEVSYFDVSLWGRSAETLKPYLTKGCRVSVEGELRQNRWEQDGKTNSRIEIVANNIQLLGNATGGSGTGSYAQPAQPAQSYSQPTQPYSQSYSQPAPTEPRVSQPQAPDMSGPEAFDDGDDIPF